MYLAWVVYIGLLVVMFIVFYYQLLFFFSRMIVKYYIDPAENYSFAVISISLSFTVSMICLLIVPIDVFVTSHPNQVMSTMHVLINKIFIRDIFLYLYTALLVITFVILPFNYFYGEERALSYDNDFDLDLSERRLSNRIIRSAKQTFYFILVIFFLLLLGLIFRPEQTITFERGKEVAWIKGLFDVEHLGEQALSFCISIILILGSCLWFVYGSYGLTALPFYLIKGTKSLEEERNEVDGDLARLREKYRAIQEKYARSHAQISKNDQKALNNIKRKERILNFKNDKIIELENQSKQLQTLFKILSPFRIIIGVISLILSLSIFIAFGTSIFQKMQKSNCGLKCGYLVEEKFIMNPVDTLFVYSSFYFPLDYLIFVIFCLYIFICTLYGIIKCGINFFFFKGVEIRKEATQPQALFIVAVVLNISILVVCSHMMTLCPQYATFGNQHFYDIKTRKQELCTLDAVTKIEAKFICQMTNISSFYTKIQVGYPIFAIGFFFSNFGFIILYTLFILYFTFKNKTSQIEFHEDEQYDEENTNLVNY